MFVPLPVIAERSPQCSRDTEPLPSHPFRWSERLRRSAEFGKILRTTFQKFAPALSTGAPAHWRFRQILHFNAFFLQCSSIIIQRKQHCVRSRFSRRFINLLRKFAVTLNRCSPALDRCHSIAQIEPVSLVNPKCQTVSRT